MHCHLITTRSYSSPSRAPGDILSGAVGAFLAWAKCYESGAFGDNDTHVLDADLGSGSRKDCDRVELVGTGGVELMRTSQVSHSIGSFIFEEILCRWGAVEEVVTDNGTAYVAALDWLADKFGIRHIRISAYNSQANGIVE
jgi:hypothetical protein